MKNTIYILILSLALLSCKKDDDHHSCYDESMKNQNPCDSSCPGFVGCDGETYCNECTAAKEGIGPQ